MVADRGVGGAGPLDEFLVTNPQWHFERYKACGYAALSFVVEYADRVRIK